MMAGAYTLLRHDPLDRLLPLCLDRSVSVLIASPYNTGILATGDPGANFDYRPATPDVLERLRKINAACAKYAVPIATAAVQFSLYHPAVSSVVVGQRSIDELDSNVAAMAVQIPDKFWHDLKSSGAIPQGAPTHFAP